MKGSHNIEHITLLGSFPSLNTCPKEILPEYAFIGRSNVGKSSLINMLMDRTHLARVSGQPGKTQLTNVFDIEGVWRIADMPGYGYAKVSKTKRKAWRKMVDDYLLHRQQLVCAFQLIDFRIDPQQIDLDFMTWMAEARVPFAIVFTKADRVKPDALAQQFEQFENAIGNILETMPAHFFTSAVKRTGRTEVLDYIYDLNDQFKEHLKSV